MAPLITPTPHIIIDVSTNVIMILNEQYPYKNNINNAVIISSTIISVDIMIKS